MSKPSIDEIIAKVVEIAEDDMHEVVAIRTQEEPFELGPVTGTSSRWFGNIDNAVYEGEIDELDGICATHITDGIGRALPNAEKLVALHADPDATINDGMGVWGGYYGEHLAVLVGDRYTIGDDPGEVVIEDAEVVYVFC